MATLDSYDTSNQDNVDELLVSGGITVSGRGQTFKLSTSAIVTSASFQLRKTNTPTGNLYYYIYEHAGTFGTSGLPTGSAIGQSSALDVSTLTTTLTVKELTFSTPVYLMPNTPYCITGEYTPTGTNRIGFGIDATSATHSGNLMVYLNSVWSVPATDRDTCFYLYGEASGSADKGILTTTGISSITW